MLANAVLCAFQRFRKECAVAALMSFPPAGEPHKVPDPASVFPECQIIAARSVKEFQGNIPTNATGTQYRILENVLKLQPAEIQIRILQVLPLCRRFNAYDYGPPVGASDFVPVERLLQSRDRQTRAMQRVERFLKLLLVRTVA